MSRKSDNTRKRAIRTSKKGTQNQVSGSVSKASLSPNKIKGSETQLLDAGAAAGRRRRRRGPGGAQLGRVQDFGNL